MPNAQHIPRRRWILAGGAFVVLATALVGFALYFTVNQPRTVALLRIAGARHESAQLKTSAVAHIRYAATRLLSRATAHYRSGRRDAPFDGLREPAWLGNLYVLDGENLVRWPAGDDVSAVDSEFIGLVGARLRRHLQEFDPLLPGPLGFLRDSFHRQPVVLACEVTDVHTGTAIISAVEIDLDALLSDYLRGHFAVYSKLSVVPQSEVKEAYWVDPLSDELPFAILPAPKFVEEELLAANVQRATFFAMAGVFVLVLIVMVWRLLRAVEREVALSRLKSDFVADVSHELKTPLALIRMFSEMLTEGRVPTEAKKQEYYGIITRESTRLTQLIETILDFSRIEAGRKAYHLEPIDVGHVINNTYRTYRVELDRVGFEHALTFDDDLPAVNADADAIAQAIVNLMSNAMKYSADDKQLAIEVQRETRRDAKGVLISVTDSGIGISAEDRAHLFDGFFRARDERVRKVRGTGLGLSVVRHIVEAHRGTIDVESRLVKGSVFRIFLPAAAENAVADN